MMLAPLSSSPTISGRLIQFVDVAWFQPEIDYDEATTDVAVVSGLDVTVVRLDGDWFLLDVAVSYAQGSPGHTVVSWFGRESKKKKNKKKTV